MGIWKKGCVPSGGGRAPCPLGFAPGGLARVLPKLGGVFCRGILPFAPISLATHPSSYAPGRKSEDKLQVEKPKIGFLLNGIEKKKVAVRPEERERLACLVSLLGSGASFSEVGSRFAEVSPP